MSIKKFDDLFTEKKKETEEAEETSKKAEETEVEEEVEDEEDEDGPKKGKSKASDVAKDILAMFEKKPTIDRGESKWPTEKGGLYSLSGVIKYIMDKCDYKRTAVSNGLRVLVGKKEIKSVSIKNHEYDQTYPYYYIDDAAKDLKEEYEKHSKEASEGDIKGREEQKKKASETTKKKRENPTKGKSMEEIKKLKPKAKKAEGSEETAKTAKKKVEEGAILTFDEHRALNEAKLENEGPDKPEKVAGVDKTNNPLPAAGRVKGISYFLDELGGEAKNMGTNLNQGPDKPEKVAGVDKTNNPLPVAGKIKGISLFMDDLDGKILNAMKDKGIPMSTYSIAGATGIDVDQVCNVLNKLSDAGTIKTRTIGKDNFWFIQKV